MNEYKAVSSGLEISRHIADCLEAVAPTAYQPSERANAIRAINDILQGRSSRTVDELLTELEKLGDAQFSIVQKDVKDFLRQRELLPHVYNKSSHGKRYVFRQYKGTDGDDLKIIDQKLYDRAARQGFPPNFFRCSYFDEVTFYCLPDHADFFASELHNCKFTVCRVSSASFIGTRFYSCEFNSSILNQVDFYAATLAHTHFHDCELSHMMLQSAVMRHCNTIDCTLDGANYSGATLDGCSFGRVIAGTIRNLDQATITQGGATEEECRRNKSAIYQALGVMEAAA